MDLDSIEYFRRREKEELDAAASAASDSARRIHLELARGYAALADQGQSGGAGEAGLQKQD